RVRHPRLMEAVEPALIRDVAVKKLLRIHRSLSNPDLRYFVALLLNVPDGDSITRLLRERFPLRNPVTSIVSWVRELSRTGFLGFEFRESWLVMLEYLLTERSIANACQAFCTEGAQEGVTYVEHDVRRLASSIQTSWLLESMFRLERKEQQIR